MVTAQEAKKNIEAYETALFQKARDGAMTQLNTMSTIIKFHSKNGNRQIVFTPYDKSLFPSSKMLDMAHNIFDSILKQNGYTIVENDCQKNVLKVQW